MYVMSTLTYNGTTGDLLRLMNPPHQWDVKIADDTIDKLLVWYLVD